MILGFSLAAVVPLALAILLLTDRIGGMVRADAATRLGSALGAVQSEIASDERRAIDKMQIVSSDPQLKRLYLLRSGESRALSEYLSERRILLDLDFLSLSDTAGVRVADAAVIPGPQGDPGIARPAPSGGGRLPRDVEIRRLDGKSGLALVAHVPVRYQGQIAGWLEGGIALDAAFLERLRAESGIDLALLDAGNRVVGGTRPVAWYPTRWPSSLPSPSLTPYHYGSTYALAVPVLVGDPPYATIEGFMPTASSDRTIASLQIASGVLGLVSLGLAILLASLWSSQLSKPVERLAAYSAKVARGTWDEPLTLNSFRELETLVAALDQMRRDLQTNRDRLIASERQAAWSLMARKVAHEVKNPLTPIAISIADLKRSYDQKRPDFPEILDQAVRTIGDEVETLKKMLQEFADFARFPPPHLAACRWSGIAADLETLYGRDVESGRLVVEAEGRSITFPADAGQMRQALVNLVQNGLEAVGDTGRVTVGAEAGDSAVVIRVADTGPGLTPEQRARLFAPGFTTKGHGSGLGLTIVERIVIEHGGAIAVESMPGNGTTFRISLPLGAKG